MQPQNNNPPLYPPINQYQYHNRPHQPLGQYPQQPVPPQQAPQQQYPQQVYPPPQQPPQPQQYNAQQQQPHPQQYQQQQYPPQQYNVQQQYAAVPPQHSVTHQGFNKIWGVDHIDLLKNRHVLPPYGVKPPEVRHTNEFWRDKNVAPDIFRCTLTKIPETKTLLQKSRLPLGILIHPFKDLTQLPVVQCSTIVRCRSCRTYINPFVYFIDNRRWKCNLCFRVNDLPDEFQYDPLTKTYGDPNRRPEVLSGTIEFLAPADYMVRPPQAAVYLFIFEATTNALESGYLKTVTDSILENLETLPGDSRTLIGFIAYNSSVHFFNLALNCQMMTVTDVEDVFVPCPEGLLVGLKEKEENVRLFLRGINGMFPDHDNGNCLGSAIAVGQKLLSSLGGRITIFQHTLPTLGPGSLTPREVTKPTAKDLNPSTDFYKKIALDCSGQYIAVDLFLTGSTFTDIASVSCVSKYSGGCVYRCHRLEESGRLGYLESCFVRYLNRKIGFEAVMRVRCSRGLSIHTFHGNLFVRSTDLLSLPNCNPDSGFGMQVTIDEDLRDFQNVAFQAALLYTSSRGERRIRVHTLCLPVASNINDIILSTDQQAVVGLLAKMGVDRALTSTLEDAREAFLNACVDIIGAYMTTQNAGLALLAPSVLQMLPVYIHGLLRGIGFTSTSKASLDDRVHYFNQLKCLPLFALMQTVYPDLYRIDGVLSTPLIEHEQAEDEEPLELPNFPLIPLCSDQINADGVYLLDTPEFILIYCLRNTSAQFCTDVFNCQGFAFIRDLNELPELDTISSCRVRNFVHFLQSNKPYAVPIKVVREDSPIRNAFISMLIEDRGDGSPSYFEFIQTVKSNIK